MIDVVKALDQKIIGLVDVAVQSLARVEEAAGDLALARVMSAWTWLLRWWTTSPDEAESARASYRADGRRRRARDKALRRRPRRKR